MDEARLAWVAGIVEGEGSIYVTKHEYPHIRLQVAMTDGDVVYRLAEWTGLGVVNGPYVNGDPKNKPIWQWSVARGEDACEILELLLPWLGQRRTETARQALETFRSSRKDLVPRRALWAERREAGVCSKCGEHPRSLTHKSWCQACISEIGRLGRARKKSSLMSAADGR